MSMSISLSISMTGWPQPSMDTQPEHGQQKKILENKARINNVTTQPALPGTASVAGSLDMSAKANMAD